MPFGLSTATIIGGVGAAASAASAISSLAKGSGSGATQSAADAAGQQAADYRQQAFNLYNDLQLPTQDTTPLKGQTWLQDFNPVAYTPWIGQVAQMSDDPASIAAEQQALGQMQGLARGGLQPADIVALQQIQQQQAGAGSSAGLAVQANAQARGLGGAGSELAGRLAGNQSAENAANASYNAAMQAAMQRQIAAIQNSGTMASNNRTQDANISQAMANINNNFNTQVQGLRTSAAQNAAAISNAAQSANLTGRQNTANNNVQNDNAKVALQNTLRQQQFQNLNTKLAGENNALAGQATQANAQQAALNTQALGQSQSTTAGLQGLSDLAKTVSNSGMFSTTPSPTLTTIDPGNGIKPYQTSSDTSDQFGSSY